VSIDRWTLRADRVSRFVCLLCVLASYAPLAMAAEFVIVESNSTLHTPGKIIAGPLHVIPGDRVTLMDANGKMHRLEGPYSGTITTEHASSTSALKAVSRLVADNATDTSTLGAIRQVPGDIGTGEAVSAELAGDQCVTDTRDLKIWREETAGAETAELRQVNGAHGQVQWSKGDAVAPWPQAVPVVTGAPYLLRRNDATIPYKIVLHRLPSLLSPVERIAQMTDLGCFVQARATLKQSLQDNH